VLQIREWSFRRLNNGAVAVAHETIAPDSVPIVGTFTPVEWYAIVASVSIVGETLESFTDARFVHQGRLSLLPPPPPAKNILPPGRPSPSEK
jgi:hypothetical protein